MFKKKLTFAVITTLGLALWVLPQASLADDHHEGDHHEGRDRHDGRGGEVKSKAYFSGLGIVAKAEHEAKPRKNESKFEVEVKFNLPNTTFDITDVADAQSTDLEMHLLRGGIPYATCMLDLKSAKTNRRSGVTQVEYKVEVKNRNGFLQVKYGYCDIDLSTPGVQAGVPAVQAGDAFDVMTEDGSIVGASFF